MVDFFSRLFEYMCTCIWNKIGNDKYPNSFSGVFLFFFQLKMWNIKRIECSIKTEVFYLAVFSFGFDLFAFLFTQQFSIQSNYRAWSMGHILYIFFIVYCLNTKIDIRPINKIILFSFYFLFVSHTNFMILWFVANFCRWPDCQF